MTIAETRREQMFPCLTNAQITAAGRFAQDDPRHFAANETLFGLGTLAHPQRLSAPRHRCRRCGRCGHHEADGTCRRRPAAHDLPGWPSAASEGLAVLVLDKRAVGGQAGASARIENYFGFATGISGQALAGRAFSQAAKFVAQIALPLTVERLECPVDEVSVEPLRLHLSNGQAVQARTVVVASGVRYRRPATENIERFEGHGVSYWASPIEAGLCKGEKIALVGGGNSAGQAVVYLAPFVNTLHLAVRGPELAASMSRYLVDRIDGLPNVELHLETEAVQLDGDPLEGLTGATFRNRGTGETRRCSLHHLFLFIGADPNTGWLEGCVDLDDKGSVRTATSGSLATNRSHVFVAGDVRSGSGSTKRVAAAVGDGAAVVAQIHLALADEPAMKEVAQPGLPVPGQSGPIKTRSTAE